MSRIYTSILFTICFCFLHLTLISQIEIPDEVIIDYSALDKPLREVLFEMGQKAEVTIAFQEEIIPGDSLINFSVRKQRLGTVIDYLLNRHHVKYKIVGDQIVLLKDKYYKSKDQITISGFLKDQESGETLINANVYLYDKTKGTISNEYGYYSFTVPKGEQRVYFSYLGYNTTIKQLELLRDTVFDVYLDPYNLLNEITIEELRLHAPERIESANFELLPLDRLTSNLPVGGEPDILRLAMTLPGVTSGADGFGGMSVRGGSTNQNLFLLDGIPVYNANHLFGLYSIFNADVIKSAQMYKGAFPSHYSGRLSSVLDIRTKEGNYQKFQGTATVGILTGKISLEGPIIKEKASFLFSARRSIVDPWIGELSNLLSAGALTDRETGIHFYDINAKVNFLIGNKSSLFLSLYKGNDRFNNLVTTTNEENSLKDFDELNWNSGNQLLSVKFTNRLSKKTFFNLSSFYSEYDYHSFDHDRIEVLDEGNFLSSRYDAGYYKTNIKDLGLRFNFDFIPNHRHYIKFGSSIVRHDFSPEFLFSTEQDSLIDPQTPVSSDVLAEQIDAFSLNAYEIEAYFEDNIRLNKNTHLNIGYNHLFVSAGKSYHIPQPRLLLTTGNDKHKLSLAVGRMGQFLHSLTNTGLGVPSDVWVPSTEVLSPETAWNYSLTHAYRLKNGLEFGTGIFYKTLNNVTRYGTGILRIARDNNWDQQVPIGVGEAYGFEFQTNKSHGKLVYNLAYTLAWSNRQFDEVSNGQKIRFRYDRRHVVNFNLTYKINSDVDFSTNWEFGSGTPITIPDNQNYNYIDNENNLTTIRIFSEINNAELPAYHRLDLGFNFYNKYKWGSSKFTLGVYNIYNRINPLYVDEVVGANLITRYEQFYLFRLMPTLSYTIKF